MVFLLKTNLDHRLKKKSEKPLMIPIPPYDPNVMLFQSHPLVSKIWARTDTNGCAIQTELVVEPDIELQLQFCHMPERYKRVLVAKVKGR